MNCNVTTNSLSFGFLRWQYVCNKIHKITLCFDQYGIWIELKIGFEFKICCGKVKIVILDYFKKICFNENFEDYKLMKKNCKLTLLQNLLNFNRLINILF